MGFLVLALLIGQVVGAGAQTCGPRPLVVYYVSRTALLRDLSLYNYSIVGERSFLVRVRQTTVDRNVAIWTLLEGVSLKTATAIRDHLKRRLDVVDADFSVVFLPNKVSQFNCLPLLCWTVQKESHSLCTRL